MVDTPSSLPDPGLFRIPPAAVARHPAVLLAPRELRTWIDSLPLANPPRTAQMLIQQLRLLVRDPQPGNRFGALLELYDAPLDQLLQIVHERLQGNPDSAVPLDQLEYQLVELLVELAHGHLRLANDILRSGKEVPAAVLFRAMSLLDGATNIERLHYHRLTPDGWRLLLNIFVHAERQRTSRQAIRSASPQGSEPDTVRGLFFRSLVISLCDPHRHRPGQILSWVHWAGQHTDALQLTVLPQGAYAIPLDISGTLPPLSSARRGKPGPDVRYVATDAFLQQLQSDPMAPKGMRQALMDVIKGRKTPEQRQSQRQPRNHPYRLLYGLRAIHRRLSELTQGTAPHGQAFSPLACRQVNQSRSGAAFHLQGPLNPPLNVGEPILAEAETTTSGGAPVGFAARVLRLASNEHNEIEIGVEKLQGRLVPVTISGAAADRGRFDDHALLQHAMDSGRFTLIAARNLFREGDTISVEGPSTRYNLRMLGLTSVVQSTAFIDVEVAEL